MSFEQGKPESVCVGFFVFGQNILGMWEKMRESNCLLKKQTVR